ncbi:GYF domain-containing protein [Pedosphaera parvula]|uniref:GYF domain-containing protein n=1 Tax=Pedosphaera parvula (strain Ellin514) TaxID=320771 RepID=B9XNQ7_PEDPL|nr:GYF domain-containing protein [Pedosphaera parvula]EEF58480.1 hypothetical protein Cflav_PD1207 [Pedosphaera parvula Ellin514]
MYKIIGADQREYGPIDANQLRQWIGQGRATAQSLVKFDGETQWKVLNSYSEFANDLPKFPPLSASSTKADDGISTIIPYKNPQALIAYYLGIFSFIPVIGFFLGIAAFVLGLRGLKFAQTHPGSKGRVHALIGIILGGLFGLLYLIVIILIASAALRRK